MLYIALLAWITWTDLRQHRIPDDALAAGMLLRLMSGESLPVHWLIAMLFFLLLRSWGLGWGDVKLAALLYMDATMLNYRIAGAFLLAFLVGALLLIMKKAKKESHLPMAPFLIGMDLVVYSIFPAFPRTFWIL